VSALTAARGYALWAPTYATETVVSALERVAVDSFDTPLVGRSLLDVGCGIARRLAPARAVGASLVAGVDLTPEMLAQADGEPLLAAADVRALPAPDASFDVVWCRLVLGHLSALDAAYTELARVCAAGGAVIVTDFHPDAAAAGHRRTFRDARGDVHEVEHHVHAPAAHRAAAVRAGLAVRAVRDAVVDDSVRDYYERAGRLELFERQRGLPLVLALHLVRAG
jgi:malonyl-CoA O-methyltransferase